MTYCKLNINGKEIKALAGQTILQVAKDAGIDIPNLCYDHRVETYGACGLCVVEIEGSRKLARACATEIADNMVIYTDSPAVHRSRKMALELLLSNHKGDCRPPCREACPAETDCQGYIGLVANGYIKEAAALIKETFPLAASIGRVCPHPCEDACRRQRVEEPIGIAWIKKFIGDADLQSGDPVKPEMAPATGKTVAIIGGGPAGLTMAFFMAKAGHKATIYEMMPQAGGMLRYGIPEYRLPKAVLDQEIAVLESMGVEILTNTKIGKDIDFSYLRANYNALYLAIGAWTSSGMRCEGEDLEGVLGGIEFLADIALNKHVEIGKKVAVVGGGNTAMDACRTAVRLGAEEVYLLYRRTKNEMPADAIEIEEAEEEGVIFKYLVAPTRIIGENGVAKAIELQQMELGEPDSSGRRRPVPVEGAIEQIQLDTIIAAIGQKVVPIKINDENINLELTDWKTIVADESTFQTSIPGVFAGGDAINNGPGIAIEAIAHARKAVDVINSYLDGHMVPYVAPYICQTGERPQAYFDSVTKEPRQKLTHMTPEDRKHNFSEIVQPATVAQAIDEANRCLECGCCDVFECKLLEYARAYAVEPQRVAGDMTEYPIEDSHPFIIRDNNKCVLCSLCVRTCEEAVGVNALGLLDRGFSTEVEADFGVPLLESRCVSCGQCVAVCPTGALQEKQPEIKSIPLETEIKPSVCNYCGVGCKVNLHQHGEFTVKVTPTEDNQLCPAGRFGYNFAMADFTMNYPLVRTNDQLNPAEWEQAYLTAVKSLQSLQAVYGREAVGVVIGDKLSTEEIFLARHLAHDILGTELIYSANATMGGLADVLGQDGSTNSFEELFNTDLVLVIGTNVMADYPMLGARLVQQAKKGQQFALLNNEPGPLNPFAATQVALGKDLKILKQIAKALIEMGAKPNAKFYDEFAKDLAKVKVSAEAQALAETYKNAKHAMIVFDRGRTSRAGADLIAAIAVLAGQIGKPRCGIIQMRPRANTQGLVDMGVKQDMNSLAEAVATGKLKGLALFGHDMNPEIAGNLDFLLVADTLVSEAMPYADVVLPLGGFASVSGSFTSSEGKVQFVEAAIPSPSGLENWGVLAGLISTFPQAQTFGSLEQIRAQIAEWYPSYKAVYLDGKKYVGLDGEAVRLSLGYPLMDGLPKLLVQDTKADYYRQAEIGDAALSNWVKAKKHYGIAKK